MWHIRVNEPSTHPGRENVSLCKTKPVLALKRGTGRLAHTSVRAQNEAWSRVGPYMIECRYINLFSQAAGILVMRSLCSGGTDPLHRRGLAYKTQRSTSTGGSRRSKSAARLDSLCSRSVFARTLSRRLRSGWSGAMVVGAGPDAGVIKKAGAHHREAGRYTEGHGNQVMAFRACLQFNVVRNAPISFCSVNSVSSLLLRVKILTCLPCFERAARREDLCIGQCPSGPPGTARSVA